jgi:hypothetical protein
MTGDSEEVEKGGVLSELRFALKVARSERIFA